MKNYITLFLLCAFASLHAQRSSTKAEHDEDARVLKIISQSMPKEIEEAPDPEERSNKGIGGNSSDITGIDGFHSNTNFATRDVFNHYYKIDYDFKKLPPALADKINPMIAAAQSKNDEASMEFMAEVSHCTIEVIVNSEACTPRSFRNYQKINYLNCDQAYRDINGYNTILFFGNKWKPSIKPYNADGPGGTLVKEYAVCGDVALQTGTIIQSIAIKAHGQSAMIDFILKQVDLAKIKALLNTGKFQDDVSESDLKKYLVEKTITPVAGNNTISFSYTDEDGNEKQFSASSSKHDLTNCAVLRNHNEQAQVMENAETTFRLTDDKDNQKSFHVSLPIIRTTGTVTATADSDHDYEVMWGVLPGSFKGAQPMSPDILEITITKWAPVGDFIEGSFSGTATSPDPADPLSSTRKKYSIKNGKFRIRRVADEIKQAGL